MASLMPLPRRFGGFIMFQRQAWLGFVPAPFAALQPPSLCSGGSALLQEFHFVSKKRTETNKNKGQDSSRTISSEISASTKLSCLIRVLLADPPSMWSVRRRLARRSIASLITDKCWAVSMGAKPWMSKI